jgi:hypothetical protein
MRMTLTSSINNFLSFAALLLPSFLLAPLDLKLFNDD